MGSGSEGRPSARIQTSKKGIGVKWHAISLRRFLRPDYEYPEEPLTLWQEELVWYQVKKDDKYVKMLQEALEKFIEGTP